MESIETKTPSSEYKGKRCKRDCSEWKKEKDDRIKKEIEEKGISAQVEAIQAKGFSRLKAIVKALSKNDNDVDKALASLKEKEEKWQVKAVKRKEKEASLEEMVQNLSLKDEVEFIRTAFPHLKLKKVLRALSESENNKEKAIEWLTRKKPCKGRRVEKYKELFPNDTEFDWSKFRSAKKEQRDENKKEREEKKAEKNRIKEEREKYLLTEFKEGTNMLYLDGNNMLFIDSAIRSLCLKKKMKVACERIADLSYLYTSNLKLNTTLIFDIEKNVYEKELDGVKFKVCSARPNYETSDDALVLWAGGLSASELANSLFVTSDRALLTRLIEKGATNIMKSGTWWKLMKASLGDTVYQEIVSKSD
jgi:hypothetical protein